MFESVMCSNKNWWLTYISGKMRTRLLKLARSRSGFCFAASSSANCACQKQCSTLVKEKETTQAVNTTPHTLIKEKDPLVLITAITKYQCYAMLCHARYFNLLLP
jgi:hypothetical protein